MNFVQRGKKSMLRNLESRTDIVTLTTKFYMCSIIFSKELFVYKASFDYCKQLDKLSIKSEPGDVTNSSISPKFLR